MATTIDHKKIGIMYLVAVLFMFFLGGMAAMAVRLELFTPTVASSVTVDQPRLDAQGAPVLDESGRPVTESVTQTVVTGQLWRVSDIPAENNNTYNRIFTLHGAIMVFMVIIPAIPAALANFFLPLQLGAKDVAFPRLNLLSFYIYALGSMFAVASLLLGGVDTGWTFYTPYSTTTDADHWRVTLMVLAAFILGFSSILTGLNFIVTVHKLRAPGMGWFDMPLFIWAIYATSIIQVLATPVIGITLLLRSSRGCSAWASSTRRSAATRCSSSTSSGSTATRSST